MAYRKKRIGWWSSESGEHRQGSSRSAGRANGARHRRCRSSSASSHPVGRLPNGIVASSSLDARVPLLQSGYHAKLSRELLRFLLCFLSLSLFFFSKIKGKIGANPSIWPDQRILMIMRCGHFLDWLFQATVYLLSEEKIILHWRGARPERAANLKRTFREPLENLKRTFRKSFENLKGFHRSISTKELL